MSQYQLPNIDPDVNTGTQLSQWLNLWANALETTQIGPTRPVGVSAGFLWIEDVSPTLWNMKVFDGVQDITIASMNPSTGQPIVGGLGTAAYADLMETLFDATPGAVMTTGAFGLAGNALNTTNYDTLSASGFYYNAAASTSGAPSAAANFRVFHHNISANEASQIAVLGLLSYSRSKAAGTWGAWVTNWNSSNLVKQTSSSDGAVGRALLTGAFGIGGSVIASADANAIGFGGLYGVTAGTANIPVGQAGAIISCVSGTSAATQLYVADVDSAMYVRSKAANVWGAWKTVSLSGGNPQVNNTLDKWINKGSVTGSAAVNPLDGGAQSAAMIGDTSFTFTTAGIPSGYSCVMTLQLYGGFVPTFPAGISWPDATVPAYDTAATYTFEFVNKSGTVSVSGFQSGNKMGVPA